MPFLHKGLLFLPASLCRNVKNSIRGRFSGGKLFSGGCQVAFWTYDLENFQGKSLNFEPLHESNAVDGMEVFQRMGCKKAFIKSTKVSPPAPASAVFSTFLSAHDRTSQGLKLGWSGAQTHWPHTHIIFGHKNGFKSPRVSGRPRPAFNSEKNENKFEWISFHAGRKCVERHFISTVSSLFEVADNGPAISCWQFEFSICEHTFWSILWCFR